MSDLLEDYVGDKEEIPGLGIFGLALVKKEGYVLNIDTGESFKNRRRNKSKWRWRDRRRDFTMKDIINSWLS